MMKLFSGLPGHGKTLRAIYELVELERAEAKRSAEGEREVISHFYQVGITDLDPAIAQPMPFPVQNWMNLPKGSVVVIDEAWKFFPQRGPGTPPEWIGKLAEHRHLGIELWLISQDPRQLDAFVRRLIEKHVHVERKAGLRGAMVFEFDRLVDDPTDFFARKQATATAWRYPRKLFKVYKSATMHLVKRKIPWKIWLILLGLPLAIYIAWNIYRVFHGHGLQIGTKPADPPKPVASTPGSSPAASVLSGATSLVGGASDSLGRLPANATSSQWVEFFTPRISSLPWSAPWHDAEKPKARPDIYCVIVRAEEKKCSCYTEQITRLSGIPNYQCELIARGGVYNPFRDPEGGSAVVGPPAAVGGPPAASADHSAAPGFEGGGLKADAGPTEWPRPDFGYRVPFPGLSTSRH